MEVESPASAWYSPDSLTSAELPGFHAVYDTNHHLLQAYGPAVVADVAVLDAQHYRLKFYARQSGWTIGTSGTIATSGTPYLVYDIGNPDASGATTNRIRITQGAGTTAEKWTEYSYTATTNLWQMTRSDDPVIETIVKTNPDANNQYTEERTKTLPPSVLVSKTRSTFQKFAWGDEKIQEIIDPDGAALTTSWQYYTDATDTSNYSKLKLRTTSTGDWSSYAYDSLKRLTKIVSCYLDSKPIDPEGSSRVTEITYGLDGNAITNYTTSMTVKRIAGAEVSRSYHREYWDGYDDVICQTAGAAYGAADNLTTSTRNYLGNQVVKGSLSGGLAGRLKSITRPDGTASLYTYSAPAFNTDTGVEGLTELTTVVKDGKANAGLSDITEGTITSRVQNITGNIIEETVLDKISNYVLKRDIAQTVDSFGRPLVVNHFNGTTSTRVYDCCHLASEADERGITSVYEETTASRSTTRLGIRIKTVTEGSVNRTLRKGTDGTEMETRRIVRDAAGRLYSMEDGSHHPTTYSYGVDSLGHQVETVTRPDGGTTITKKFKDGSTLSVTGSAASPVRYEYGRDAEGVFAKVFALDTNGNDAGEWTRTTTDAVGRVTHERTAAGAHSIFQYSATTGQLIKTAEPDGVTQLFGYDTQGRRNITAVDMNRDGVINYNGSDRITRVTQVYGSHAGVAVSQSKTEVWNTNSVNTPVTVSLAETALTGFQSWQSAAGLTSSSQLVLNGNGSWTETKTAPDNSKTVSSYLNGRLDTTLRKDSTGAVIDKGYTRYDAHGRVRQTEDGLGAQSDYSYDAADRVATTTGPLPKVGGTRPITQVTYTLTGQQDTVTDTAGGTVSYTYWPTGTVKTVTGNRAYPISYTYTAQGRMSSMTTATGTTNWMYVPTSGLLWKKLDAATKGPVYTYTNGGRLLTSTNARGAVTTYGYTNAGEVLSITYNDNLTPGVTNVVYNRLGQRVSSTSGGLTQALGLTTWGQLTGETYTGGSLNGLGIAHSYDTLKRRNGIAAVLGSTTLTAQGFGYDNASRLKTVTGNGETAIYGYDPNADLLISVSLQDSGVLRMTSQRHYDLAGRLDSVKTLNAANAEMFKADYGYNSLDQRTGVTREDGAKWAWGYNDRGEVTSGGKKFTDGTAQPMLQFGYQYDGIGNRTQSDTGSLPVHSSTYTPNSRNQYVSRTVPPYLSVTGEAAAAANVVVQAKPALRNSAAYWKEWSVDNTSAAVRENVRIAAARPGAGAGGTDLASLQTGQLYLPPATESFTYDDDGNLTSDSRWTYTWDAANRLLSMEEKTATLPAGWVRQRLEFAYDAGSRRTRKTVKQWTGTAWNATSDTAFVYDGWNLIAEVNVMAPASPVVLRTYAWGLDVSQTMQGAGGVGGLLWAKSLSSSSLPSFVFYPAYDGNGNIIGYVDASNGQPVLKLDYDPFGVPVMVANIGSSPSATAARALPFRFSTKYQDRETGLDYYGYRYYAAGLGRWINRDPIGEQGGVNLYGFVKNRGISFIDLFGLSESPYSYLDPTSPDWDPRFFHPGQSNLLYSRDICGRLWVYSLPSDSWLRLSDEPVCDPNCVKDWEIRGARGRNLAEAEAAKNNEIGRGSSAGTSSPVDPISNLFDDAERRRDDTVEAWKKGWEAAKVGNTAELMTPGPEDALIGAAAYGFFRWSSKRTETAVENAFGHWKKHGAEFPEFKNATQYVRGAENFFSNPPTGTLTKVRSNGDKLFYDPVNNIFGIQAANGAPRTMFKPDPAIHRYPTNLDYFHAQ